MSNAEVDGQVPAAPLLTDTGYDVVGPGASLNTDPDMATEPAFDAVTAERRDRRASDR